MHPTRPIRNLCRLGVVLLTLVALPAAAAQSLGLGTRAALQAAMQRHIDRSLVDGAYLHMDPVSGEIRALHPQDAHPMILRMGERFVLCATFLDGTGAQVNIDFYVAPAYRSYVVFSAQVENRELIRALMAAGTVVRAD